MFGGCPYFLNKTLDKVYSKLLRRYDTENWKNWSTLINEPWRNICYVLIVYKVVFVLKYENNTSCLIKMVNL